MRFEEDVLYQKNVDFLIREELDKLIFLTTDAIRVSKIEYEVWVGIEGYRKQLS